MGHIRLGVLPKYRRWKEVMALLDDDEAPVSSIADKVLDNSRGVLASPSAQASVGYCIWLLAQLTLAARGDDFNTTLAGLGVKVSEEMSAAEFLGMASRISTDYISTLTPHTAFNNLASLALREALTKTVGIQATTLFGAGIADVQLALRHYSSQSQFSKLLHVYFSAFLSRTLRYILDKEVANHLGPGMRFGSLQALDAFEGELDTFAGQTTRIVDEFSGGWYSKRVWQQGAISESDAMRFAHVAMGKLRADLELSEVQ